MLSKALLNLIITCAPMVAPDTMAAVITVESSHNPYAIGVVGGHLVRQPRNLREAIATAHQLEKDGWNYSVGIAQINKKNFSAYGLRIDTAFDPCRNLKAGGLILQDCYMRSLNNKGKYKKEHLSRAFSCYYSGRLDSKAGHGYANKVFKVAAK